ncbi:MAG: calcium-binding protein [Sulfitobacter sp.]
MPIEVISADQATAYGVSSGDDVFLLEGVNIISTGDGISGIDTNQDGTTLTIRGNIIADRAIDLWGGAVITLDNASVFVGAQGTVNATTDAIVLDNGLNNQVINYGEIIAQETGIFSDGGSLRIENHGSINSNGNVQGAILIQGSTGGDNVREVINTGIISGAPVDETLFTATISNSGGAAFHLNNSGSIIGGNERAVYSSADENWITNSGIIDGAMRFTEITEMFNSGTIDGEVDLSDVGDYYFGSGAGVVTGRLDLNGGNDEAIMGDAGSFVDGGTGDDTIRGGTGSDEIEGGDDNDDIRGRAGADNLDGGSGNDIVRAGRGDDVLDGGSGNDFMRGGAGDDVIIGGLGQDTMFGNAGADVFDFNSAAESPNAGVSWDRIMDFTQGQDLVDLSQFNARFIGTGAYAANGNIAEVRIFEDPNGDTRVFVDVNADGTSDMRFYLVNTLGVTADDFIL